MTLSNILLLAGIFDLVRFQKANKLDEVSGFAELADDEAPPVAPPHHHFDTMTHSGYSMKYSMEYRSAIRSILRMIRSSESAGIGRVIRG
jgi:hypothetical protein